SPGNFAFSRDGRYLHGSSYFTGVSNLWRYDFETRKTEILTNAETGLFRPLLLPDGRLMAYEYTASGFRPVFVDARPLEDVNAIEYLGQATVKKYPQLRQWDLPAADEMKLDALRLNTGVYSPAKGLERASIYPIVQGYKNTAAGGFRASFTDPLRLASVSGT